jgi:hypothetical protein
MEKNIKKVETAYHFFNLLRGGRWYLFIVALIFSVPGLQRLLFVIPNSSELRLEEGKISHEQGAFQSKGGFVTRLKLRNGDVLTFSCRISSGFEQADCFKRDMIADIEGANARIWWYPQTGLLFSNGEKRAFRIEVNGKDLIRYEDLRKRYEKKKDIGFDVLWTLTFFFFIFVFTILKFFSMIMRK